MNSVTPDSIARFNLFVLKMRKEIEGNTKKGDWAKLTEHAGMAELEDHLAKMHNARNHGDREAYFEHLADIANSVMFIANGAGFLDPGTEIVANTWSVYDDYWSG